MREHAVHAEVSTHVAEHVHIVQIQQPVAVVDNNCLIFRKIDEPAHLLLEAVHVVLNGFLGHHFPHVGFAGGVADHCRAAADQNDRLVPCHLESLHQAQCHEVSHVQAVCGRVEANVKGCLAGVDQFLDLLFIGHLGDQAPSFQFFKYCHVLSLFPRRVQKSPPETIFPEDDVFTVVPPQFIRAKAALTSKTL